MTILSLDIGAKRIGVAISHGIIAEALQTLNYDEKKPDIFLNALKKTVTEQKAEKIIVGLPFGRNQKETVQSRDIREITKKIEAEIDVKTEFVEESYSTADALRQMQELAQDRKNLKKMDKDSESARIILEQYLNSR